MRPGCPVGNIPACHDSRSRRSPGRVLVARVAAPSPASAWGFAAHRYIMRRAIDLLPAEIKPFFVAAPRRARHARRSIPISGATSAGRTIPNHFVELRRAGLGPFPFTALAARLRRRAREVRRRRRSSGSGTLPWRDDEEFGNLRRAFEGFSARATVRGERRRAVCRGRVALRAGRAPAAARARTTTTAS